MTRVLKAIFMPHDGSRKRVVEATTEARNATYEAMNRLEQTVSDLLERNDNLTHRKGQQHATRSD